MNVVGTLSVSLTPGMYIDINIPVISEVASIPNGMVPKTSTYYYAGTQRTLRRGFFVDNEIVGHLEELPIADPESIKPEIRYVHDKPFPNRIYFVDMFDDICVVDIVAVPIHDHSSIAQGGPAYGTYYSNYNRNRGNN